MQDELFTTKGIKKISLQANRSFVNTTWSAPTSSLKTPILYIKFHAPILLILPYIYLFYSYRYLVICYPMKAQYISTSDRAKKIITVVWLSAIGLSAAPANFVSGVFLYNSMNIMFKQIHMKQNLIGFR